MQIDKVDRLAGSVVAPAVPGYPNLCLIHTIKAHCILNCGLHTMAVVCQRVDDTVHIRIAVPGTVDRDYNEPAFGKLGVVTALHLLLVCTAMAGDDARSRVASGGIGGR
ncbi:hypothetical protein SDC9_155012 [bioreactor metagenome]|uniref:Uncharacterized protein n=1 Tax=bioreactor metagenome TaxID=1076179 RepID=A0A645F1U6_9ZZZZ